MPEQWGPRAEANLNCHYNIFSCGHPERYEYLLKLYNARLSISHSWVSIDEDAQVKDNLITVITLSLLDILHLTGYQCKEGGHQREGKATGVEDYQARRRAGT